MDISQARAQFQQLKMALLQDQQFNWLFWSPFNISIPAGQGDEQSIDIKSDAHFMVEYVTGNFTTLNGAGPADDGTNHITLRITDGSNDLKLFDAPVPLDLFLSPGRVLAAGVAGNPSNQLFYPIKFEHTFPASGKIILEFQNNADQDNEVNLLFMGRKLLAKPNDMELVRTGG